MGSGAGAAVPDGGAPAGSGGGPGAVPGPVRVVVVDDDALVRAGLRLILGGDPGLSVVGECADGQEAVAEVLRLRPDVVLMDVRMPRVDGLTALRTLRARGSAARVVVLTTFDADELVLRALREGAAGFLLKDTPPAQLVDAVRRVAAGEPALSPTVTAQLIASVAQPQDAGRRVAARRLLAGLTPRERDVALAVAEGLSNTEIAAQLHLGLATVKTHVGHLYAKLGAANRVQVARVVHDAGRP
ncbi:response regulator [Cellulomonas shaoxiangyii]|uniref:Response regulator transcription factor n=2 Tax=Cellulomonas shaoxiangyii TaxID=2566013 RepID=A0A4P7SPG5_9CELL|nr:response regulator transcription factor [Cellulomonas shaoxiangyii]QCB94613.1 response regulator transcription factor [Cellulomonas shaoxiangyii]TGY84159.1 response regulator transcription factor [Cellulomonas shaoxiangyii]